MGLGPPGFGRMGGIRPAPDGPGLPAFQAHRWPGGTRAPDDSGFCRHDAQVCGCGRFPREIDTGAGDPQSVAAAAARAACGSASAIRSMAASSWAEETNHASKTLGGRYTPCCSMAWKNGA